MGPLLISVFMVFDEQWSVYAHGWPCFDEVVSVSEGLRVVRSVCVHLYVVSLSHFTIYDCLPYLIKIFSIYAYDEL